MILCHNLSQSITLKSVSSINTSADNKQLQRILCSKGLCAMYLWITVSLGPGFVSAYVLSSEGWTQVGWVSLWNERSHGSTRPDTAPLPGEPGCVFYQQKSCPSVSTPTHINVAYALYIQSLGCLTEGFEGFLLFATGSYLSVYMLYCRRSAVPVG